MAVDKDGRLIEPAGGWAKSSKSEIDTFMTKLVSIVDDESQPRDYRAKAKELAASTHQKLAAIPASVTGGNRWLEIGGVLMVADFELSCVELPASKHNVARVAAMPSVETPTAVAESPELDAPEFF